MTLTFGLIILAAIFLSAIAIGRHIATTNRRIGRDIAALNRKYPLRRFR